MSTSVAWKPQHGTNKEVWSSIVERFNNQKSYTGFTTNISWESAKDQFISMLDRQRRQKKKGTFAAKLDALNARIDGQPGDDNSETRKIKIAYDIDERLKKFSKKSSVLEPGDIGTISGLQSVDIGTATLYTVQVGDIILNARHSTNC